MLNFGSKIQFHTRESFGQLPWADAPFVDEWDGHNIVTARRGFTRNIVMCNSGGVTNGQDTVFFHFQPFGEPRNKHERNVENLEQQIHELQGKGQPLRGLLLGGHSFDFGSEKLRTLLSRMFRKNDIPFSALWGHRHNPEKPAYSWRTDYLFDTPSDTWHLYAYNQGKDVTTKDLMQQAYQDIVLDAGDEVWLSGRKEKSRKLHKRTSQNGPT